MSPRAFLGGAFALLIAASLWPSPHAEAQGNGVRVERVWSGGGGGATLYAIRHGDRLIYVAVYQGTGGVAVTEAR